MNAQAALPIQFFSEIDTFATIPEALAPEPPFFFASVNFGKKLNGPLPE
jgi:hypothetical protein